MNLRGNTVLVTGGASGIGLAIAQRFLRAGSEVIVCGRREDKLAEVKEKYPDIHTHGCDVAIAESRKELFDWTVSNFPELNVLVNNAGIQQRVNLQEMEHPWDYYEQEIAINADAPIHLSMLFLPHLKQKSESFIINVSSGLALTPATWVPIYSATKAALHSFTTTMRLQLAGTGVNVIEVLPPAVNTDLGGVGLHTFGAPLDDFANAVFVALEHGDLEIGFGGTEKRLHASSEEIRKATVQMWESFKSRNPEF